MCFGLNGCSILPPLADTLHNTCLQLDVNWNDLRTTICRLHPIFGPDETMLRGLVAILRHASFPGEPFSWPSVSRSPARRFISTVKAVRTGELPKSVIRLVARHGNALLSSRSADVSRFSRPFVSTMFPSGSR